MRAYRSIRALIEQADRVAAGQLLEQLFGGRLPDLAHGDVLTPEQVRTLSRDARVTIGAHTVSHPVLRSLTEAGSRRRSYRPRRG
jgi:hypothetical protein